jgi:membrane associated rhomboid family serine protease
VKPSEPIFNIPTVLVALIAVLVLLHAGREWLLSPEDADDFLLTFAFLPARYDGLVASGQIPDGLGPQIWTFFTYALIHADWLHLGVNTLWLLPFGTAVARRVGAVRFLLLFAVTAAAGAVMYLVAYNDPRAVMIGASGSVSGLMAAATRFAFQSGGPLETWRRADDATYQIPAPPLLVALRNPRIFIFLAVWFGLNLVFGVGGSIVPGASQEIAWQTHIGGFLAGLLLFPLFDPVRAAQQTPDSEPPHQEPE